MIFLASHEGQAILFRETEVRADGTQRHWRERYGPGQEDYSVHGRGAARILKSSKGTQDETQNLEELENEQIRDSLVTLMLTVAEKGYGKRTPLAEYRITSRGGKGRGQHEDHRPQRQEWFPRCR
jgi:DNA gyrase subunit A